MNDSKWEDLRSAMYALERSPTYRCMTLSGYYSEEDAEWYYHFRAGGYDDIRYVDLFAIDRTQREHIRRALEHIGVSGEETAEGFRVHGPAPPEQNRE